MGDSQFTSRSLISAWLPERLDVIDGGKLIDIIALISLTIIIAITYTRPTFLHARAAYKYGQYTVVSDISKIQNR